MLNYKTFFKLRKESKDTKPHMHFQTYLLEPRLLLFPKQNALISLFICTAWINSAQKGPLERMLNIKRVHFPKKKSLSYKTQPIPGTLLQSLPLMRLARSRITQTTFKSWLISHRASLSTHKDFPQGLRG